MKTSVRLCSSLALGALVAAAILLTTQFAAAQVIGKAPEVSVATAFEMRTWMSKYGVARASVAVMRNDRLVFAEGYGGLRPNDRVLLGSLSKAITAFCVGTLVRDGKLRLDQPIGPLLALAFKRFGPPTDARLVDVTIAQLLSHRSGIPREFQRRLSLTWTESRWLWSPDGKWVDDRRRFAYTLGVNIEPTNGTRPHIFHEGAWTWHQGDAAGGAVAVKRGAWFVLAADGIAWFASFDGVSGDVEPEVIRELRDGMLLARRRVTAWPEQNNFEAMGVGPILTAR